MKTLVTIDELSKPILVEEAYDWIESLLKRFDKSEEFKQYLLLRKGVSGKIYNELLPLAVYGERIWRGQGVSLKYYPTSSQSFDADFINDENSLIERVEVTMATEGLEEQIQAETLVKYGWTPGFGMNEYGGNARNREIPEPEHRIYSQSEAIDKLTSLVNRAYNNKLQNRHKYHDLSLLIAFDCFVLNTAEEFNRIVGSISVDKSTFNKVHFVDTGRRFYRAT
ncbi:MAG: hypothetical protein KUF82_21040 [Candidatus Thiodiazotropha sp. (ex Ctena orbiculata)]|nr:hypothetical protein [Candidatus Thiodiazotropha taylori]